MKSKSSGKFNYFLNALADKFQVVAATFYIFTSKRSNNIKVIFKRNLSVCLHGTRVLGFLGKYIFANGRDKIFLNKYEVLISIVHESKFDYMVFKKPNSNY